MTTRPHKKIFWNHTEKQDLIEWAAMLIASGSEFSRVRALNVAQLAKLPVSRRRKPMETVASVPWFTQGVEAALKRFQVEKQLDDSRAAPQSAPVATSPLADSLTEVFLAALETPRGQAAIRAALASFEAPAGLPAQPLRTAVASTSRRKQRVLIVGLLGVQEAQIKNLHDDDFELRFLGSDDSQTRTREQAKGADIVIGMVDFMSHNQDKALKESALSYKRVTGNVSNLKIVLQGEIMQRKAA